jgi:hypothetical protein
MGGRGVGTGVCVAICAAILAAPASAATHSNATPILDPSYNVIGAQVLVPYPSTISVSGEQGAVVKARVTLSDLQGGDSRDLDVVLVAPGGSTILLSDICSTGGLVTSFNHNTFTFDDDASAAIPDACSGQPPSGAYKPSNYDTSDSFPGIAPPYPIGLANVRGTSPNGNWSLYAVDDSYPDPVTINGGWSLDLTTTGAVAATPKKKCKKRHRRAAESKKKRCKKKRR